MMLPFSDILVLLCLCKCGLFFGFYLKYSDTNRNHRAIHWHAVVGIVTAIILAFFMICKKIKQKQDRFDHLYVILLGLICFMISALFLMTKNLGLTFYFGFAGHAFCFLPSFTYISLRSSSCGYRPSHIALGNTIYFGGMAVGFTVFNTSELEQNAWISLGTAVALIISTIAVEILQLTGLSLYKNSCDSVFNVMNEERIVFTDKSTIKAQYEAQGAFHVTSNDEQKATVLAMFVILLHRSLFFSVSFMTLTFSVAKSDIYSPFMIYSVGCGIGSILMIWYKPCLTFLMFSLIKVLATVAILGVYDETNYDHCFVFICIYYSAMGVYSSIPLQGLLESSPFQYTELVIAMAYQMEIAIVEILKYETEIKMWTILLSMGILSTLLALISIPLVLLYLPKSEGLVDVRNKLLGIRRHTLPPMQRNKGLHVNFFPHPDIYPSEAKIVKFQSTRVFQQISPSNLTKTSTRF